MKPSGPSEQTIFEAALQVADPHTRAAYLDTACTGDAKLRERLEALLAAGARADEFLARDPLGLGQAGVESSKTVPLSEGPGTVIDKYKLLEKLGEGGFGVVYMAEQREPVKRRLALKIIKVGMDTREVVGRFEAERQALALMDHPNIAKVLDAGATETGRPYFVMELVRGTKITDYCDEKNLSTKDRLGLFSQVCQAVQHAHQKGIIHRDLKPSNILVTVNDAVAVPKIIDFGIAKATQTEPTDKTVFTRFQQFIGTPAYVSPEQAELTSVDIDTRSDIYSLGVLLYELLTGKTPFDSKELLQAGLDAMRRTIREKEPAKPSTRVSTLRGEELTTTAKRRALEPPKLISVLRGDLDWIVMKCLEKDRARRYETANGLAMDIERHLNDEPVAAGPPGTAYKLGKFVRRNKVAVVAGTAVTTLLVLGVVASTWEARQQRFLRQQAQTAQAYEARERAKAQTEAAKSQQVAQFLKDMLAGVGPSVALGRDTTILKEILDKTAERVGKDLTNQPEVEIELRATLARAYLELGLFKEMEEMATADLKVARAALGQESSGVAQALHLLGEAQTQLSKYDQAEATHREALALRRRLFGNEHLDVSESLNDLAMAVHARGKLRAAETLYREALAIVRRLLGNEHVEVSDLLDNLAFTLQEEGKLGESESLSREALGILRKLAGNYDLKVATCLNNLGLLLGKEGKQSEAESIHREVLAMRRKLLGDDHPDVAQSLYNLAFALQPQGKLAEAEPLLRESLAIVRRRLGNEHLDVAFGLNSLARVLSDEGKLAEAEASAREALQLRWKLLGDEHAEVADSLYNLATVLKAQGRLVEAETSYGESLAMYRKLLGNQHPYVATSLLALASLLQKEGKVAEAEPMSREALAMRRKLFGEANQNTLRSLNLLVLLLLNEGKLPEAQTLCQEYLVAMRAQLSADDPALAGALSDLAATMLNAAKPAEAEPLIRECLAIREKKNPDDWKTFQARAMLGSSLLGQNKYAEAQPLLLAGYDGLKQREAKIPIESKPHLKVKECVQSLVQLYEATGQSEQAAEWRKMLQAFDKPQPEPQSAPDATKSDQIK